jgi:hypothetical protein
VRPHITQREAAYLVELLQSSQAIHNQLEVYFKELEKEVYRLDVLRRTDPYEAFKQGLTAKRAELETWGKLRWGLGWHVYINKPIQELLISKYSNIANNDKHRGKYKHLNTAIDSQLGLRDQGSVAAVLEKELQPIETLGVKP